jgi:PhnB protein
MAVTPYLFFDGRCEEALEFYKRALGAEVETMMRFKEAPDQPPPGMLPPGSENLVSHGIIFTQLRARRAGA